MNNSNLNLLFLIILVLNSKLLISTFKYLIVRLYITIGNIKIFYI